MKGKLQNGSKRCLLQWKKGAFQPFIWENFCKSVFFPAFIYDNLPFQQKWFKELHNFSCKTTKTIMCKKTCLLSEILTKTLSKENVLKMSQAQVIVQFLTKTEKR